MTQPMEGTRAVSPAIQDYLKACFRLRGEAKTPVSLGKLAHALGVAPPSVTNMVKRMEQLRLIRRGADGKLTLTPHGEGLALEVIRHHRLLETFLVNELRMEWAEAHKEAEVLEHYISERLEALLDRRLARPHNDPHGEPIPAPNGAMRERRCPSLLDHAVESVVRIERVASQDATLLQYLQDYGLVPGARVHIREVGPFNGPVTLEVNHHLRHVSREVAACITGVRQR